MKRLKDAMFNDKLEMRLKEDENELLRE